MDIKHTINLIFSLLARPKLVALFIVFISAFSLAAAYTAEYVFDLKPCILCLYQRIPFALTILTALLALYFMRRENQKPAMLMIAFSGFLYIINGFIAFYHTGVEQKWWISHLEACKVDFSAAEGGDILSMVENARAVPCDEIPWQDPILGLSMANYNILLGLGMGALCLLSAYVIRKGGPGKQIDIEA